MTFTCILHVISDIHLCVMAVLTVPVTFCRDRLKTVLSRCSSLSSVNSTDDTTVLVETNCCHEDSDTGMVRTLTLS